MAYLSSLGFELGPSRQRCVAEILSDNSQISPIVELPLCQNSTAYLLLLVPSQDQDVNH